MVYEENNFSERLSCWYVLESDAFQRFTELLVQVIQELQTQECWDLNLSVTEASYCRMGFCEVAPRTVDWSSSGRGYGGGEEKMQCLEQIFNFSNCVQGLQGN